MPGFFSEWPLIKGFHPLGRYQDDGFTVRFLMSGMKALDKNMPILIVDDFSTMRRTVKTCLHRMGFENITEAEDGVIALRKLRESENRFGLIISDWNMPNMMGIDLLREVRGNDVFNNIPFVMVTDQAQHENIVEAARAGVSNYIEKPFTADGLQQKLQSVFLKIHGTSDPLKKLFNSRKQNL